MELDVNMLEPIPDVAVNDECCVTEETKQTDIEAETIIVPLISSAWGVVDMYNGLINSTTDDRVKTLISNVNALQMQIIEKLQSFMTEVSPKTELAMPAQDDTEKEEIIVDDVEYLDAGDLQEKFPSEWAKKKHYKQHVQDHERFDFTEKDFPTPDEYEAAGDKLAVQPIESEDYDETKKTVGFTKISNGRTVRCNPKTKEIVVSKIEKGEPVLFSYYRARPSRYEELLNKERREREEVQRKKEKSIR